MLKLWRKTFGILVISLILFSLVGLSAQAVDMEKTYKFGMDADYPPWCSYKQGKAYGFEVEVFRAIAEHFDLKYKFEGLPWKTAVPALAAGKLDVLFGGMYITEERDKKIDYSAPYYTESGFLLVKKDSDITLAELLAGNKKLGGLAGGTQYFFLQNWAKKADVNIRAVAYETDELALKDLEAGRISGMLADGLPTYAYLKDYDVKRIVMLYNYANQIAAGVQEGDPDNLVPLINEGMTWLWESGKWQELWNEYMPERAPAVGPLPLERE